jgi:hypothetical protein
MIMDYEVHFWGLLTEAQSSRHRFGMTRATGASDQPRVAQLAGAVILPLPSHLVQRGA